MENQNQKIKNLLVSPYSENHFIALSLIKHFFENGGNVEELFPAMIDSYEKLETALEVGLNFEYFMPINHLSVWYNPHSSYNQALWLKKGHLDFSVENQITEISQKIFQLSFLKKIEFLHQLLTEVDDSILNLKHLESIKLSNNRFTKFPEAILNIAPLKELHLSNNMIEDLPKSISQLKQLEVLNLKHNKIKILPPEISSLNRIKKIILGENKISKIPTAFFNLENLEIIDLQNNQIITFPEELLEMPKLKILSCKGNAFSYTHLLEGSINNQYIQGKHNRIHIQEIP